MNPNRLWASSFAAFGVISDATRAPTIDWVSRRLRRPAQAGDLDEATFEAAARSATRTPEDLAAARHAVHAAVTPITTWWDDHDVLVTPTTFEPAWPLGGNPGSRELGTLVAPSA